MIDRKKVAVYRLSNVIGVTLSIFLLVFSLVGLLWTYSTTNHLLAKQVLDAFEQRLAITTSIFRHQEQLLLFSLSSIKNNPDIVDGLSLSQTGNTQQMLVEVFDSSTEFPLDILFVTSPENEVLANVSSPFYNVERLLSLMIKERVHLLSDAKMLHFNDGESDFTLQSRAVIITDEQTGKVVGTLFGGTVLNDNTSLLLKIRRETGAAAVTLLSSGEYLASTEKKDSQISQLTLTPQSSGSFFSTLLNDEIYSVDNLIFSPRMQVYKENGTAVEVVFAMPDTILVELRSSYLTKSIYIVCGALFFIFLSVLVIRTVTVSSLRRLLNYSDEIAAGKPSANYQPGRVQEFNQLGYAMENMVIGLKEVNEQLSRDVIARTEAENALRKSEVHLRTLLENIPDLIWLKDKDGVFLSCNRQFERFMNSSQEEIIGKTDYDFFSSEIADFFRKHDQAAMDAKGPRMNEEAVSNAFDGRTVYLETIKTPMVSDDNKLIGVLGIARDITERKEGEEERKRLESQLLHTQKVEAIGTMAGGIAHDFNNILAAIIGYAEIARYKLPEGSPSRKPIKQVIQASTRAKELVQHILSFSRRTELKDDFRHINLVDVAREVLGFQQSVMPKTIKVETDFQNNKGLVLGEPTQLHQVLMNLCTNAWQAMEKDGGTLKISVRVVECSEDDLRDEPHMSAGSYVKLSVSDTGIGMDPEVMERIFDPYYTTKGVGKGSGMGLSVVVGIVKNHGGLIRVSSSFGIGSSFEIVLPQVEEVEQLQTVPESSEIVFGTEHILLVDDEEMLVDAGKAVLESCGYTVTGVTESSKAWELFKADPSKFDLMITDQTMPDLQGADLAKKVLELRADFPIILCTGYSSQVNEAQAKVIGVREFASKPMDKKTIARLIRKVLAQQ